MIEILRYESAQNTYKLIAKDTENNKTVGYSELKGTEKPVPAFFCKVDVPYMGKHVGTELLKKTVIFAKEIGAEGIFVRFDGNVRARMMLKKQGFRFFTNEIALLEF